MIVADTSGLLALFNSAEPAHGAVRELLSMERSPLIVSPFVVAELDYLVATRIGTTAELAVLAELAGGAYQLDSFDAASLAAARDVVGRYADQQVGVTDASLVVLAERHSTRRILTLDRRHFDVMRPVQGGRFEVLPRLAS